MPPQFFSTRVTCLRDGSILAQWWRYAIPRYVSVRVEAEFRGARYRIRRWRGAETGRSLGARQPVAFDGDAVARHEHCERRLADPRACVCRLVPRGAVDRPRVASRDHDTDRQRRTTWRHRRPATAVARWHRHVHRRVAAVRHRAHALAAHRSPRGAGPWCGDHDGTQRGDDQ